MLSNRNKQINYYEAVAPFQNELICVYDKNLKLKWVNLAYANHFGKTPDNLINKCFLELMPKSEHTKLQKIHKYLDKFNPTITHTDAVFDASGNITWQKWRNVATFDENGDFLEFIAVGIDVTETVNLKNKLKEAEAHSKDVQKQNEILLIGSKDGKNIILKLSDIFYFRATLKQCEARTINGFVELSKSIGTLEKSLSDSGFFRVHRSCMVNLEKIDKIDGIDNSRYKIHIQHLSDTIDTSKDGAKRLREHSLVSTLITH